MCQRTIYWPGSLTKYYLQFSMLSNEESRDLPFFSIPRLFHSTIYDVLYCCYLNFVLIPFYYKCPAVLLSVDRSLSHLKNGQISTG